MTEDWSILLRQGFGGRDGVADFARVAMATTAKLEYWSDGVLEYWKEKKRLLSCPPFTVPISFFKSISIMSGGADLIFEGLTNRGG